MIDDDHNLHTKLTFEIRTEDGLRNYDTYSPSLRPKKKLEGCSGSNVWGWKGTGGGGDGERISVANKSYLEKPQTGRFPAEKFGREPNG